MSKTLRLTVLVENSVHRQGLAAEHGLSVHVQFGNQNLLFDTGQTDLVARNASALGINLGQLDAIALSHGHYDHTGGIPAALAAAPRARIHLHPAAFEAKFSKHPGIRTRAMGMGEQSRTAIRNARAGFIATPTWTEIGEGIFVTGEIPRATAYEDTGGLFFLDAEATRPDPIVDDQAMVIDLGSSVVLLLGCAHSGVVNTLDHVRRFIGSKPMTAVIGGIHLGSAGEQRIERTIARLRTESLRALAPMHCTGWPAIAKLWQAFREMFRMGGVGSVFEFVSD